MSARPDAGSGGAEAAGARERGQAGSTSGAEAGGAPERGQAGATSADALRAVFDEPGPLTVGLEEEVMLLHPDTLDLLPRAAEALAAAGGDPRFKLEMPAAQLEIITPPAATVSEAAEDLVAGRAALARAAAGLGRLAGAGAHPFAAAEGVLNEAERYVRMEAEYGSIARRQLVFGLHVHVAVRPAHRALGVYNALRGYLPELAALAANAPFHAGGDTGLASVRPKIAETLPRQGVPPAFEGIDELAGALRWGEASGALPGPGHGWWWELRLHQRFGTVEVRVPDTQATVGEGAAIAAVVHALAALLAARHDAGDLPPPAATWRIEENRWSACRHGLDGRLVDLATGVARDTRERLGAVMDELGPSATLVGCEAELACARRLVEHNGAERQREVAAHDGLRGLVAWLAGRFEADEPG